jgi:hypothetical protein
VNDKTPLRPEREFVVISPLADDKGAYLVYWDDILDVEEDLKLAFHFDADHLSGQIADPDGYWADLSVEVADLAGYFYKVGRRTKRRWWGSTEEVRLTRHGPPDPSRLRFLLNQCFDQAREPSVETLTESELFEIVRSHHPVRRKK